MNKIILIGSGGHASSCIDVVELESKFKIAGILEIDKKKKHKFNYRVFSKTTNLKILRKKYKYALISIGQIKNYKLRKRIYDELCDLKYYLPVIKSPFSYVSAHSKVDKGTIIMHGAIVNAGANIGSNCIINSKSLIEHDVRILDNCHVATGAIVNGGVRIGRNTFVGSGSIIKEGVLIGNKCIIGAGKFINKNIPDNKIIK